jgi:lipopolysaccharide core galacturonosyltransferase RgtB
LVPPVRRPAPDPDPARHAARLLLERYLALLVAFLVLSVPFLGLRVFKARWCLPLLVLTPLALFLRVPAGGLGPDAVRRLTRVFLAVGILTLGARLADVGTGPWLGVPSRLHLPITEIAAGIRGAGFRQGTIVAGDGPLGGNLRLHFPDSRVLTPELRALVVAAPPRASQCLVAWRPRREPGIPPFILDFAGERLGRSLSRTDSSFAIAAPLSVPRGGSYVLRVLALPPGPPPCGLPVVPVKSGPGTG